MKQSLLGTGLMVALCSGSLWADEVCDSATTQAELNECSAEAYQLADSQLNDQYQRLMERFDEEASAAQKLRAAQRAWIGFRDAECEFVSSSVDGGSAQPMVRNFCLAELTEQRVKALAAHAECEEGDLSCS